MRNKKKPVTLADIAKSLGVSTATVSLALQNKPGVSLKTRERVQDTVNRLGYVYNRSAARLRTQRSFTIGLIVPNIMNPFFTELTNSVEEHLVTEGLSLLLAKTSENLERQTKAMKTMLEYGVDGILLCPTVSTRASDLTILTEASLPFALFTRNITGIEADYVGPQNKKGTQLAAEFLLQKGHTRIAFIGGLPASTTRKERYEGFQTALKKAGVKPSPKLNILCETSLPGGYQSIQKVLTQKDSPTAVVCYNDVVAFGVILGLWALRIAPGNEFPVIGFDNITDAALWSPPLTTISCPPQQIGEEAITLLLQRIENPALPPRKILLSPSLVLRESCK
jgi:LacI family transcriptional regulator